MGKLFISHSTSDDAFVRDLCITLALHGQDGWVDSRQIRGGGALWTVIENAIAEADGCAVLVSPASLQSKAVGQELKHALKVQQKRGADKYPVIPLLLDGTKFGVFEFLFDAQPVYIPVSSEAGGVEAAIHALLVALGKRLPSDAPAPRQAKAQPLEELVLELSDLRMETQDGKRRATARAQLAYEPAASGQSSRPTVRSPQAWRVTAPLGPIEADDLRWYLEQYPFWPSDVFEQRAKTVEAKLAQWGQQLHAAALPAIHTSNVTQAWARLDANAGRRFSVYMDTTLEAGQSEAHTREAQEAANEWLKLPWELLHDGRSFLFQGAKATRVRRRLPNTGDKAALLLKPPIRVLLLSPRPEDAACGYLDHRSSAEPLVRAMEGLPGLVHITCLTPPTLPALSAALEAAQTEGKPYHVLHFDGHGVYDPTLGLGALCFEDARDVHLLSQRRHALVTTQELGPLLRDYRIPLVVLDACQTAQADKASESVASELLKGGVASVVAMSHSVLVATAERFMHAFYDGLAGGKRVGEAMLTAQRRLKDDANRGNLFGLSDLSLQDWFVPILFQEKDDPQLFSALPAAQTVADAQTALKTRLGELPAAPEGGFVGRSRELLMIERLLSQQGYAVLRGQGGEGKTALAVEYARWQVRAQQVSRVAFVSVETHSHPDAVLDALGRQLVGASYSRAQFADADAARLPIERALREQSTLLLLDNVESILLPPFEAQAGDTGNAVLASNARANLDDILQLCQRLSGVRRTRLIFTSREALPAPFGDPVKHIPLHRLDRADAVKMVERNLSAQAGASGTDRQVRALARDEVEALVDTVHCHARTLTLLAGALRQNGTQHTHAQLTRLMHEMAQRYPDDRQQSLFASVALSLRRMSPANQTRVRVLGLFHGGVQLGVLREMMAWEREDVDSLARDLLNTGLATPNPYDHLSLSPGLCPYLHNQLSPTERRDLATRWQATMRLYINTLMQQYYQDAQITTTLTQLEINNLFALLTQMQAAAGQGAAANIDLVDLCTDLYRLLQWAGKTRLLQHIGQVRDAAAAALDATWGHASFQIASARIEQQLANGDLRSALAGSQALLARARAAGEATYVGADYDLVLTYFLLGRVLKSGGKAQEALSVLQEAHSRFKAVEKRDPRLVAEGMDLVCLVEQGECLRALGHLDEAAMVYETCIHEMEKLKDKRGVATIKLHLGIVYLNQQRYAEALQSYAEARTNFSQLGEPRPVASAWHHIGMVYEEMNNPIAAEESYRQALAIWVRLSDKAGESDTLLQLGNLYRNHLKRPEQAVTFYRQAVQHYIEINDVWKEGAIRSNLAETLRKLNRLADARTEIRRAIECVKQFGPEAESWIAYVILSNIERAAGKAAAAQAAQQQARAAYLAYRRNGGDNHTNSGRLALAVAQAMQAGAARQVANQLQQLAADPDWAVRLPFLRALQAIVSGSRDPALANDPNLRYTEYAEIVLLLERLAAA